MKKVAAIPEGYHSITPYLIVHDATQAIDFYKKAFNAVEIFRMQAPDNKIRHAELRIGNSILMLADEHPEQDARGPKSFGGSPISIYLYVNDVDSFTQQAVAAGAKVVSPVEDMFYGDRNGMVEDPYGYKWCIATHVEDVSADEARKRAEALYS